MRMEILLTLLLWLKSSLDISNESERLKDIGDPPKVDIELEEVALNKENADTA